LWYACLALSLTRGRPLLRHPAAAAAAASREVMSAPFGFLHDRAEQACALFTRVPGALAEARARRPEIDFFPIFWVMVKFMDNDRLVKKQQYLTTLCATGSSMIGSHGSSTRPK